MQTQFNVVYIFCVTRLFSVSFYQSKVRSRVTSLYSDEPVDCFSSCVTDYFLFRSHPFGNFLMHFLPQCSRLICFLSVSMKKCFMIISVILAFRISSHTLKMHRIQRHTLFISLVYKALSILVPYCNLLLVLSTFLCVEGLFRGWRVECCVFLLKVLLKHSGCM